MINLIALKKLFRSKLKIQSEEAFEDTYTEISEGILFKGSNFWILACTMFIACIGLNIDSTSAIIGAMLISPLMGPIVGLAFAIAINDAWLKKKGLINWLWMTFVSLVSSTLFFIISPFDSNTFTLLSFTKASIFDIMLAFFGGIAGFIGIIKKDGTKVLSGVAVATACMPPLCTAGFGIAHLNLSYFLGGLYFYLVNCLFIGLATFMVASLAGYKKIKEDSIKQIETTKVILWIFIILIMLLPGCYLAYVKFKENKTIQSVKGDKERIENLEKKVMHLDSLLKTK